jgi:hypothetical protein
VIAYYILLIAAYRAPHLARFFRRSPEMRRAGALSALFVVPVCLTLFAWRIQPDGRLRIIYVPEEGGEAAVVIAPNGRTVWVWDGMGDGEALAETSRRGGWVRGNPDVSVTRCEENPWKAGRCVDLATLGAGARLVMAEGVELTRLDTAPDPVLLLTHGDFRTVLPAALSQETQRAIIAPVSALKLPAPGTGAWPSVSFLQGGQPQLALWPLETTYPPTVSEYLQQHLTTARIEPHATVEIVTDGEGFWVIRHSRISAR